jgi:nitroimidazol reductase NimA-like FMN-containing flavoprotein (pyridoxamine 5'-phosphate oxidase superfamily)
MSDETPHPRTRRQRIQDALSMLKLEVDAWVATADPASGTPYLVPLSFLWDGTSLLFSNPESSVTSRNLRATGKVRVGIGPTRELLLIEGTAEVLSASEISEDEGDAFAVKTGFDPRELGDAYIYFRVLPVRLQAWREANELPGRELMRGGVWIDS